MLEAPVPSPMITLPMLKRTFLPSSYEKEPELSVVPC